MQIKHKLVTDFKFWNILAPFRNKLFLKQYSHLLLHHHWLLYCMYVWIFPIFVIDKIQVFFSKAKSDDPWMTFSAMLCRKKLAMHACKIRGSIYVLRHYIIDYLSNSIRRKMCEGTLPYTNFKKGNGRPTALHNAMCKVHIP